MDELPWFILIYQLADAEAQEHLAAGLKAMGGLIVQTDQNNGEYFVTIECRGHGLALTMHELVMAIDCDAELIDTHSGLPDATDASEAIAGLI